VTSPDTTWLDATAQAALVRSGEVSPKELVEAAIARIEALNPQLNAVIRTRFDQARAEAAGDLPDGPFRGVPILLKDLGAHVAGEPTAHGVRAMHEVNRPSTSYLASSFREAGFVVLGRTNVPELGSTVTTEPAGFPPARNPWNPDHSTGGSSGGSAAAVASGMVAAAHANDGGGSIRIPASECGLVGLKPTRGRVSQGPEVGEGWAGGTIDGAVTRTVRDAAAILDALSTPRPGEPYYAPPLPGPLRDEVGRDPGRLRIGFIDGPGGVAGYLDDPECRAAVVSTVSLLSSLGHEVEQSVPAAMYEEEFGRRFPVIIAADTEKELREFEALLGRPLAEDELEPRNLVYRQWGATMSALDYLDARAWLASWSRRMAEWWTSYDVLVTPTVGAPPPPIGWFTEDPAAEGQRIVSYIPYTAQFNMTGQPAVSLPLHWSADGLPVGVQFVGAYGREDVLVRLAAQLEEAAPWADRRPPVSA
jgi:amidase